MIGENAKYQKSVSPCCPLVVQSRVHSYGAAVTFYANATFCPNAKFMKQTLLLFHLENAPRAIISLYQYLPISYPGKITNEDHQTRTEDLALETMQAECFEPSVLFGVVRII